MTAREALAQAQQTLNDAGVEESAADAQWLLAYILHQSRLDVLSAGDLSLGQQREYAALIARRACREPLQYILGTQPFGDLKLRVTPGVLIPRGDTEFVAEAAAAYAKGFTRPPRVLDLCCGSGAIGLYIKKQVPQAHVTLADLYDIPLGLSAQNAKDNGLDVTIVRSDLFDSITARYDIIVSNPPYIETGSLSGLQAEVSEYEPREALDGGTDGLDFYKRILLPAYSHLNPGGILILEVGALQADSVRGLPGADHYAPLNDVYDLSGIRRAVAFKRHMATVTG